MGVEVRVLGHSFSITRSVFQLSDPFLIKNPMIYLIFRDPLSDPYWIPYWIPIGSLLDLHWIPIVALLWPCCDPQYEINPGPDRPGLTLFPLDLVDRLDSAESSRKLDFVLFCFIKASAQFPGTT